MLERSSLESVSRQMRRTWKIIRNPEGYTRKEINTKVLPVIAEGFDYVQDAFISGEIDAGGGQAIFEGVYHLGKKPQYLPEAELQHG